MQLANPTGDLDQQQSCRRRFTRRWWILLFINPAPMIFGRRWVPRSPCRDCKRHRRLCLAWPCAIADRGSGTVAPPDVPLQGAAFSADRGRSGDLGKAVPSGVQSPTELRSASGPSRSCCGPTMPPPICSCATTVVACTSGGVGRAFGRPRIFHIQILFACGPAVAALLYVGGAYHIALALLSFVFFIAIQRLTSSLQRIYLNAWVAREREAALAGQFDTALNNMPHGLCMFRPDGRLAVMNHRFERDDEPVRRYRAARRQRGRHHRRPASRPDRSRLRAAR